MRAIAAILLLLPALLPASAQKPRVQITTTTGQTTFHLGERIPLTLSFTGPTGSYNVLLYNFGRVDPLMLDSFTVSPATGWEDSLAAYANYSSGICCGAKQYGHLSSTPLTLDINLNEWARFDEPGTYTVTLNTHRIYSTAKGQRSSISDSTQPAILSNPLSIKIIPATPEWQAKTLARSLRAIAAPHEPYGDIPPQRKAAIADLRFLATPAAINELAANVRDDQSDLTYPAILGLVSLPRNLRDTALAAMNRLIDDPDFPISQDFLETMPWLQLDEDPRTISDLIEEMKIEQTKPDEADDEALHAKYSQALDLHRANTQPLLDAAWESTAKSLPRKKGIALGVTAQTLAANTPAHPSASAQAQIGALLRASLPHLTPDDQAKVLATQWDLIRSRSLLPYLRVLAKLPHQRNEPPPGFGQPLRVIALERWYDLEPEAAMTEILRQLGTSPTLLTASDLHFLPPLTFPQFESLWAKQFADGETINDYEPVFSLLLHFGTGAVENRFTPLIAKTSSDYACNRPYEALAYLVKFDPQAARRFLTVPPDPPGPGHPYDCSQGNITSIAEYAQDPVLTEAALTALKSATPTTVSDALNYLTKFGDDSVRQPILDRYLAWFERSSRKPIPDDDDPRSDRDNPGYDAYRAEHDDFQLGTAFADALLTNHGWLPDAALSATVLQNCLGPAMCADIKRLCKPDLSVNISPSPSYAEYDIGNFRSPTMELLESKLDQFPPGTTFTLDRYLNLSPGERRNLESSLVTTFTKHGMTLALPDPQ